MAVAVQHIAFGNLEILLCHQSHFHLVLNILHAYAVIDTQARQYSGQGVFGRERTGGNERFGDSVLDFVNGKNLLFSVSFNDVCFHIFGSFFSPQKGRFLCV